MTSGAKSWRDLYEFDTPVVRSRSRAALKKKRKLPEFLLLGLIPIYRSMSVERRGGKSCQRWHAERRSSCIDSLMRR
jgi:hypothetical protein